MADPVDHLYMHHLRELGMGGVPNQGGLSTIYGMTAQDASGRHRIMPTVWDNQILSPDAAFARASSEGQWNWPGSFSPTRALYNYMNDPAQHPRMEQDVQKRLQESPFTPAPE